MNMDEIRYFRAASRDVDLVTELRLEVLEAFQGPPPPGRVSELRPQLRDSLAEGLEREAYVCWLAECGGIIAGSGGMAVNWRPGNFSNPSGRTGYIMSMYTRPGYRGRGICSELVRRLTRTGRELGITHFELHATRAGEPIYQKLGFLLYNEPTYRKSEAQPS